ncbi:hypothetical protein GCM10011415_07890 [Salipiger pallidus]|uniref:DUF1353 domain-containing protein n=1 Tax=Salipiger pallidus TaxID=1775170 RepID=A0A8J2ZHL6_9RHOB|nr:DUF1353 domain-containing protein [Salipiger pallidus]GGG63833.1 hypothetical protein GCM10011415_07890 [Salipiger pallidus]
MSAYTELTGWHRPVGGIAFEAIAPVRWELGVKGSDLWVIVPTGFVFDCSVPRWLCWAADPLDTRYRKASCLHDYLLVEGWGRVAAGAVFHDALQADGVPPARRIAMWLAVSLFRYR